MSDLTLGSLFDGSGGFPLGGLLSGITPVWASEIEPFPIRVTTKRLPFVKHYGDISQMDGGKIEPVDIITFGSPCTDMSIAGRRAGLDGQQSVLFYQAIHIIKEMRCATNGKYPRYICWENVVGAFSSNAGCDFKAVLEAVIGIVEPETEVPPAGKNGWPYADCYMGDGWSVAYRTLDACGWGVPQRRRRIYLVADFAGGSAGKILFESEGVSGYSAESFRAWQRAARNSPAGAGAPSICLNDQGGARMTVTDGVSSTLRAEEHRHPPCVMEAAGFCTEHSARSRSIGYEEERSPTLRAGVVPATVYENHSQDTRFTGPLDVAPTVSATYGMGGNNQPFVVEDAVPFLLKIRSGCEGGGKGPLIQEDISATISCNNDQTLFAPKVYGICSDQSHAMLSDNPHSGIYEAETTRTLDANGGNPGCNQGGMAVVESYAILGSMIGRSDKNGPQGDGINKEVSFTLDTVDRHAVCSASSAFGIDRAAFNQGKNAQYSFSVDEEVEPTMVAKGPGAVAVPVYSSSHSSYHTSASEEVAGALIATDYKDPPLINEAVPEYTVRRLTPTECARLQGFPDWWCADLGTPEPTMDDLRYWYKVFETHRKITGSASKPKTLKQITKWLSDPHTDAAEYKMWGNGVALPCVYFVLSGIAWAAEQNGDAV